MREWALRLVLWSLVFLGETCRLIAGGFLWLAERLTRLARRLTDWAQR